MEGLRTNYGFFGAVVAVLVLFFPLVSCSNGESQVTSGPASFNTTLIRLEGAEGRVQSFVAKALAFIGVETAQPLNISDMVKLVLVCGLMPGLWLHRRRVQTSEKPKVNSTAGISDTTGEDAVATDPGLLKKHSVYKSYTVPQTGFTYPSIRTFYRPHPQGDKLPTKPAPLPLLVFVHGLGGSAAQFQSLLTSLVNLAPCLAIDMPGCGLSKFAPRSWEAYETGALVHLLATVIEEHLDKDAGQGIIFVGHSMGCSIATLLASTTSPYSQRLSEQVLGLVAICPKAEPPTEEQAAQFRKLLAIPGPIFDLWRAWDRRGGTESASVRRFVGPEAEEETKKLQVRFNEQSRTSTWRRMAKGMLGGNGLPGKDVWGGLDIPVFLAAGEADPVTPADEVRKIASFLGKDISLNATEGAEPIPDSAAPIDLKGGESPQTYRTGSVTLLDSVDSASLSPLDGSILLDADSSPELKRKPKCLKTVILPSPASHALLYAPTTSRTIAGLIQSFLAERIDKRLSLGWQLQYLTTEGKWDVKNLAKWQAVTPVSRPIAGTFRAMKTLREVDDKHCPAVFVQDWAGKIKAVVDISHESPVYDPNGLEKGGIQYHKFPTVSKLPPTVDEVKQFITLIDQIREESKDLTGEHGSQRPLIGVHCHYGFNRTGFFIVCYLVERLGWGLQAALQEFAEKRPPGIRHDHFIDTLFVRYHVGLKRAPTL